MISNDFFTTAAGRRMIESTLPNLIRTLEKAEKIDINGLIKALNRVASAQEESNRLAKKTNPLSGNCVHGEQTVITREYGKVPISEIFGKTVHVLNSKGDWVSTDVSYEKHPEENHETPGMVCFNPDAIATVEIKEPLEKGQKVFVNFSSEKEPSECYIGYGLFERYVRNDDEDYGYLLNQEPHVLVWWDGISNFCCVPSRCVKAV